jgi:ribosomal protein L12E/L44/L45/RPP1/RPP2
VGKKGKRQNQQAATFVGVQGAARGGGRKAKPKEDFSGFDHLTEGVVDDLGYTTLRKGSGYALFLSPGDKTYGIEDASSEHKRVWTSRNIPGQEAACRKNAEIAWKMLENGKTVDEVKAAYSATQAAARAAAGKSQAPAAQAPAAKPKANKGTAKKSAKVVGGGSGERGGVGQRFIAALEGQGTAGGRFRRNGRFDPGGITNQCL